MRIHARNLFREDGFALVYMSATLAGMLLFTGLAVDAGRAYVVKAQLTKAVDGAALASARSLNRGDARGEAERIFKANFPVGALGTSQSEDPTDAGDFFNTAYVSATGVNVVTVTASVVLPTTFMRVGGFEDVTIKSTGEATRRMVDLSLVLDVSSSIGSGWPAVRDAARNFVDAFDASADRFALVTYGNGAQVLEQMRASRGFDKAGIKSDIATNLPGGSTAMVEGLYRGWDEVRTVPGGSQSGLRVIVLFTDGASNSVPGIYDAAPGQPRGVRTYDFPKNYPDPDGQTWDNPQIHGLYNTQGGAQSPTYNLTVANWNNTSTIPQIAYLPLNSFHAYRRSSGIPTAFPLQSDTLKVDGVAQSAKRGLRSKNVATGRYPAQVFNINNAARNLVEIIADAARSDDDGDYPIRIYTIGMGELVRYNLGTIPEKPESILMRVANDKDSADFNEDQPEGKYYYAKTPADVGAAFQELQNEIIRLTK